MFIPTKHEDLQTSTIVLGADIIKILKKRDFNIEELFNEMRKQISDISLNQYYTTITFLWLTELIKYQDFTLTLKK